MQLGKFVTVLGIVAIISGAGFMWRSLLSHPYISPPDSWEFLGPDFPAPPSAGPHPNRPTMGGVGWHVVETRSVLGVLIATVETDRIHEAPGITHHIINLVKDDHIEALVYFHRPHEHRARTRVQWTPSGGYVKTDFPSQ